MNKFLLSLVLFSLCISCKKNSLNNTYKIKSITSIYDGTTNQIIEFKYDKNDLLTQIDFKRSFQNSIETVKFEYNKLVIEKIRTNSLTANLKYDNGKIIISKEYSSGSLNMILSLTDKGIPYKKAYIAESGNSIIESAEIKNNTQTQCMKSFGSNGKECEWFSTKDNLTINPLSRNIEVIVYNWIFSDSIREAEYEKKLWGFDSDFTPSSMDDFDKIEYIRDKNNFPQKALLHLKSGGNLEYIFKYY